MAQVILIESDKTLRDLLQINLSTYTKAKVIMMENAQDTMELLDAVKVDVVICSDKVGDEDTAASIMDYTKKRGHQPPVVVLGAAPPHKRGEIVHIPDKRSWESIVRETARLLGMDPSKFDSPFSMEYAHIPIRYFDFIESIPCDIFIRIKHSPTEFQFIKRLHADDKFTQEDIAKYKREGLTHFYIPKGMERYFTGFVSNNIVAKLENKSIPHREKLNIMGNGYDIATREIMRIGLTTATMQLVDSVLVTMVETIQSIPKVNALLLGIVNSRTGFLYQHAHMSCTIATACIQETPMYEAGKVLDKLAFASFFQNISLVDDEELAKISSQEELDEGEASSEEDRDKVLKHALRSCETVQTFRKVSPGADVLVKHHHGSFEGVGFLTDVENLPELSRIFVISSDFSHKFLSYADGGNRVGGKLIPIMTLLKKNYSGPRAKGTFHLLDKAMDKRR